LSKLFDALIDLGFGVDDAEGVADGDDAEGEAAGVEGDAEAGASADLSLPHPKSKSSAEASPRTIATRVGDERTGEGYSV
jgi:hypothetical protein